MISVAPNHLRTPLMNPYILYDAPHLTTKHTAPMRDPNGFTSAQIANTVGRHGHKQIYDNNNKPAVEVRDQMSLNDKTNKFYIDCIKHTNELKKTFELLLIPFKDYPFKDQLVTYMCDTFMSVVKDPSTGRFINKGFFGAAIGLGARFNLSEIRKYILSLDPKKAGVPLDDISAAQRYLEGSPLFKKLSGTNRHLALSCTMNEFFNKSDMSRSAFYAHPNGPYMTMLEDCIRKRDSFSNEEAEDFLHSMASIYYNSINIVDPNRYISKKEDNGLNRIVSSSLAAVPIQ